MSDGIPSAVQIVNELKAYMELKDKQVITAEQLKNAKILCKEMASLLEYLLVSSLSCSLRIH